MQRARRKMNSALHIVHEVCDPLTAILTNAEAARRWLSSDAADLDEARQAIERIAADGDRAAAAARRALDVMLQVLRQRRTSASAASPKPGRARKSPAVDIPTAVGANGKAREKTALG